MLKVTIRRFYIAFFFVYLYFSLYSQEVILLSGRWGFKIDRNDVGIKEKWYLQQFKDIVPLPGSMQEGGFGDDISSKTPWVGGPIDNFFKNPKYKLYRREDNFKFPFWLTPNKYYKGVAWYQREISIPSEWIGKPFILSLERCHWSTRLYFDDIPVGADSSLSTPHNYIIGPVYVPGKHIITLRVDNNYLIDVGENAHSVSDQTQGNWNGIIGNITLSVKPLVYIDKVEIYPDIKNKSASVHIFIRNTTGKIQRGDIAIQAATDFSDDDFPVLNLNYSGKGSDELVIDYPMGDKISLWNEFTPNLYSMKVMYVGNHKKMQDKKEILFGMRDFKVKGTRFEINGLPVFLRGTLECAVFPSTGYPPTDTAQWSEIFRTIKRHGLNHMRFHSWCPTEAAFVSADKAGVYLQVEVCAWAMLGSGGKVDSFLYAESKRIINEYGNHPSFCMMVPSNEPSGGEAMLNYVSGFVEYWKNKDNRRLYSAGSGWPSISVNDYHITPEPRIQHWGEGLNSIINASSPNTSFNYQNVISKWNIPVVSHETGQWCVYPDFDEIKKYSGFMKPKNFEIFRDFLNNSHMLNQAHDFLMASGKLQALCYKNEIEAILRTQGIAGFQLLGLHDFPGQGTALVGVLDPFWDSKPYIAPEQFRYFCNTTVPLAILEKFVWKNNEVFKATIQVSHFGSEELKNAEIAWEIKREHQNVLSHGIFHTNLTIDNNIFAGEIQQSLLEIKDAEKLNLVVSINGEFINNWNFWVYPSELPAVKPENIIITDTLSTDISMKLFNGASVLLLINNKVKLSKGKNIKTGFSTIFWNTEYTNNQAPHTLGILCNPQSGLFKYFPTEYHTNMQWWDIVTNSQAMILNDFPATLVPSVQLIDTWFEARKLGIMFEAKVGNGKIVVTSIDFKNRINERIVARQLYYSLLNYMKSKAFNPTVYAELGIIKGLYE